MIGLTAGERAFFGEHGWLVVRGAVAAARVAELERALDAVVPPAYYERGLDGRVLELPGISRGSAAIAAHARDAAIGRLAAEALGARRVQLLQDSVLIKAANDPARVAWHQDFTYLGFLDPPRIATARLALTRCDRESGCMRVLDGSHAWGLAGEVRALQSASVEDALALVPEAQRANAKEILLELEPGDVSLHHCLTFHSSGENRAAHPRKTLLARLFDGDCKVLTERLSPEAAQHFRTDGAGRLSGEEFPLVYEEST